MGRTRTGSGAREGPRIRLGEVDASAAQVSPSANHYWHRKRREVVRLLATHVELDGASRIVDLGTGPGDDIPLLSGLYPQTPILGVDGDPDGLQAFRDRHASRPLVDVIHGDLRSETAVEASSADLVFCSEVLEHMPDPRRVAAEAHRILKPGGWLLMTTPNEPNVLQRAWWLRRKLKVQIDPAAALTIHGHISLDTASGWDRLLAAEGFKLIDVGRGALFYGGRDVFDAEGMLAATLMAEALLDLAPRRMTRRVSDQVIGLYRRS